VESSSFEEVAEATDVEDMSRFLGKGLDLLPQVVDMYLRQLSGLLSLKSLLESWVEMERLSTRGELLATRSSS